MAVQFKFAILKTSTSVRKRLNKSYVYGEVGYLLDIIQDVLSNYSVKWSVN